MQLKTTTKILIVDDCKDMRRMISSLLYKSGLKNIESVDNGVIALDILDKSYSENSPIEIVLADWNMPGLSGMDLLKKMKDDQRFKNTIFIMLTAVSDSDQVIQAITNGVDNYLLKPITSKALLSKIKECAMSH